MKTDREKFIEGLNTVKSVLKTHGYEPTILPKKLLKLFDDKKPKRNCSTCGYKSYGCDAPQTGEGCGAFNNFIKWIPKKKEKDIPFTCEECEHYASFYPEPDGKGGFVSWGCEAMADEFEIRTITIEIAPTCDYFSPKNPEDFKYVKKSHSSECNCEKCKLQED